MAQELAGQLQALGETPRRLYFASGSRGTQAGIVLGMRLFEVPGEPRGICISLNNTEAQQRALANANIAAEMVGSDIRLTQADLVDDEDFVGEAYAVPTEAGDAAIDLVAKTQAIFLDPVYTGKGMSAVLAHIRSGKIGPDETVVFVHTGGSPSVFVHAERLAARAGIA